MGMRAALVANREDVDPGLVGRALRRHGYTFTEFLREDHEGWLPVEDFNLVLALGSNWSTYWDHVAGPVRAEQELLREAMRRKIPVLGICFGAQQVAAVLGGEITKAQSPEIGWCQVFATSEAGPTAPSALTSGPWMQWHYDRFSVPSGATVLADSPIGPQAMVVGRTLAVQFHPEATETIVSHWSSGTGAEELDATGISKVALLSETRSQVEGAEIRCNELVDWFISTIAQGHMGSPTV